MTPEQLALCLEEGFGSLEPPRLDELAAADTYYVDKEFVDAVKDKRWQDLRPMRLYVGDYSEICLLAPKAYQYYLPAYLHALIDKAGDGFNLLGVLDSLWYEDLDGELLYGRASMRERWGDRMALLIDQQKKCIAHLLVESLNRTDDRFMGEHSEALRIEYMLKKFWDAWL